MLSIFALVDLTIRFIRSLYSCWLMWCVVGFDLISCNFLKNYTDKSVISFFFF